VIEKILKDTKLVEVDGTWVLLHREQVYVSLLDAKSHEDAEQQLAQLLLLRHNPRPDTSEHQETAGHPPTEPAQP
jgi:hypothetical protein